MSFETLILRPESGVVDVAAVTAHLDALAHAFLDPVEGDVYHLSATARAAAQNRELRVASPREFPSGVLVSVSPDHVWMAARADRDELARGLEFVRWLAARGGGWTATVDQRAPEPLGDPARLFPDDLPDPATLVDDLTISPVPYGVLTRWTMERDGDSRVFSIHTSGAWRYEAGERELRGDLRDAARTAWRDACAALDPADPALPESPDPDTAISLDLETPESTEWAYLDATSPPPAYRPAVDLVLRWTRALDGWSPGVAADEDLLDVRPA